MTPAGRWSVQRYVVVDVEGNGARPPALVELAAVPILEGVIGNPISWLVRPRTPITWQARRIHGITNETVADRPRLDDVRDEVLGHLHDAVIVGHNVRIDLDVLTRELSGWQPTGVLDTLRIARKLLPDLGSHKLGALAQHLDLSAGLSADLVPHRASYDAMVTARLLVRLATAEDGSPRNFEELRDLGGLSGNPSLGTDQPGLF